MQGGKCTRLWAHLLTACHKVHSIPPPHPPTPLARFGCLSVPFRQLAGALVAYLFSCLLFFFSGCLPETLAAYLVSRLLAGFKGCFPSLRAACPSRVIRSIPFSTCSLFVSTCQIVLCRESSCLFRCLFVVNCCRTRTSGLLSG